MVRLLQSIPAKYRQLTYFGYVLVVFVLGAIEVGMEAAEVAATPVWFIVTSKVVQYLGIPVLAVAGVNVTTASGPPPAPDAPEPLRGDRGSFGLPAPPALLVAGMIALLLLAVRQPPVG